METRHPLDGQFGSEFPAICNHCRVMPAWSREKLKIFETFFCFFWKKSTSCGKISKKILFRKFSTRHRSTFCFRISWNLADGKSVKSCVAYVTEKKSAGSQAVAAAQVAPKICQGQPPDIYLVCFRLHPNRCTLGGVIAERVNTVFCPVE